MRAFCYPQVAADQRSNPLSKNRGGLARYLFFVNPPPTDGAATVDEAVEVVESQQTFRPQRRYCAESPPKIDAGKVAAEFTLEENGRTNVRR